MSAIIPIPRPRQRRCRHCRRVRPIHRRGLCQRCYYNLGIRCLYWSLGKRIQCSAREGGFEDRKGTLRKPWFATSARPGTAEKIDVMAQRWARGEAIHHPDDAKQDDEGGKAA